jgi:hypothetical protein
MKIPAMLSKKPLNDEETKSLLDDLDLSEKKMSSLKAQHDILKKKLLDEFEICESQRLVMMKECFHEFSEAEKHFNHGTIVLQAGISHLDPLFDSSRIGFRSR